MERRSKWWWKRAEKRGNILHPKKMVGQFRKMARKTKRVALCVRVTNESAKNRDTTAPSVFTSTMNTHTHKKKKQKNKKTFLPHSPISKCCTIYCQLPFYNFILQSMSMNVLITFEKLHQMLHFGISSSYWRTICTSCIVDLFDCCATVGVVLLQR